MVTGPAAVVRAAAPAGPAAPVGPVAPARSAVAGPAAPAGPVSLVDAARSGAAAAAAGRVPTSSRKEMRAMTVRRMGASGTLPDQPVRKLRDCCSGAVGRTERNV